MSLLSRTHLAVALAVCVLVALLGVALMRPTSGLIPAEPARLRVLIDREEVFPASIDLLRGARSEILVGMYIFGGFEGPDGGPGIGKEIVDLLAQKQEEGVRVRIISQFKRHLPDRRVDPQEGDPWFAPVFEYARERGLEVLNPGIDPGTHVIDHRKFFVVDGERALLGGMNFAEAVASNHDAMLVVEGPLVARLRTEFYQSWRLAQTTAGQEPNPVPELVPIDEQSEAPGVMDSAMAKLTRTGPGTTETLAEVGTLFRSLGKGDRLDIAMLLFTDDEMLDAVVAAHERGVKVRVLLDGNRAYYGIDGNYAYNADAARRLHVAGVPVRFFANHPGQELHLKLLLAERDGTQILSLGSTNFTGRGLNGNFELQLFAEDAPQTFARLQENFDRKWSERTIPVPDFVLQATPDEIKAAKRECTRKLREESWAPMVK